MLMQRRSWFITFWYGSAVAWNLVGLALKWTDQTASHGIAALIADKRTRVPVSALIIVTVVHLFALAAQMAKANRDAGGGGRKMNVNPQTVTSVLRRDIVLSMC